MKPITLTFPPDPHHRFLSFLKWTLLIVLLVAAYLLAKVLPSSFGWENGAIENFQAIVLLLGMIIALLFAFQNRRTTHLTSFGWAIAIIWFICFTREISWGAVFFPPLDFGSHGPVYSSRSLWYKGAVYPVIALLAGESIFLFVKYHLHHLFLELIRKKRFPWQETATVFLAVLISNFAENHDQIIGPHHQVLEELTELLAYLGLLVIQLQIFIQTRFRRGRVNFPL